MSTKTNKLKTKDLIVAGAFAALYVVVLFAVVTVMGFVPHPLSHRSVCKLGHFRVHLHDVCYESTKNRSNSDSFGGCRTSHFHWRCVGISDLVPRSWNCSRVDCPRRKS